MLISRPFRFSPSSLFRSTVCVFTLFVYITYIPLLGCYDADIDAGYDPPKFEDELLSVRRGKILEDAGLFPVKYENNDWEI